MTTKVTGALVGKFEQTNARNWFNFFPFNVIWHSNSFDQYTVDGQFYHERIFPFYFGFGVWAIVRRHCYNSDSTTLVRKLCWTHLHQRPELIVMTTSA